MNLGRSTTRAIRWERCSSIYAPLSPSSKPISSACAPQRVWQLSALGGNCAASSPNCPTDSSGNSAGCMSRASIPSRSRRALIRLKTNCLPYTQPTPFPLAYDPAPTGIDPLMLCKRRTVFSRRTGSLWPAAGAAMRGMAREYAAGNSRGPGWCEFPGSLGQLQEGLQTGSGVARNQAMARLNWVSQGQRCGRDG